MKERNDIYMFGVRCSLVISFYAPTALPLYPLNKRHEGRRSPWTLRRLKYLTHATLQTVICRSSATYLHALLLMHRKEISGQLYVPAALPLGKMPPLSIRSQVGPELV